MAQAQFHSRRRRRESRRHEVLEHNLAIRQPRIGAIYTKRQDSEGGAGGIWLLRYNWKCSGLWHRRSSATAFRSLAISACLVRLPRRLIQSNQSPPGCLCPWIVVSVGGSQALVTW